MVYDMTKCSLTDGDLKVLEGPKDVEDSDFNGSNSLKQLLRNQHKNMLHYYNLLLKELEPHHEVVILFKDHIAKLKELNALLDGDFTAVNFPAEVRSRKPQMA